MARAEHITPRELASEDEQQARIKANIELFFSVWAKKHDNEIAEAGVLEHHTAQDPDVPITPAAMPEAGESLEDFADDIRMRVAFSFKDPEKAQRFLTSLDRPYPDGSGRSYLEVLDQDYSSHGIGVAPLLGHLDNGLTDVPRATGLLRSSLVAAYGPKYLDAVGEVVSKTLAFETIYEAPVPETLAPFGEVAYVAPWTKSVPTILKLAGLNEADYQEIARYINNKGARPIAEALRGGKIRVFASGNRTTLVRDNSGNIVSGEMDPIDENAARLIGFAGVGLPIAIVNDEILAGTFMPIQKPAKELNREEKSRFMLWQVENMMDQVAELGNQIIDPGASSSLIHYSRSTPRLSQA